MSETKPAKKKTSKAKPVKKAKPAPREASAVIDSAPLAMAGDVKPLGWLVWWDLRGAEVDGAAFETALASLGHGDACPAPMSPERRLTIAMGRKRSALSVDFKRAGKTEGQVVYRPVHTEKKRDDTGADAASQLTVDPMVMSSIAVDVETGALSLGDGACIVAQTVATEYHRLDGRLMAWDISSGIVETLWTYHAVALRRNGGMYFVPFSAPAEVTLKGLAGIVEGIGECEFFMPLLPDSEDWTRAAQSASISSLEGQYSELFRIAEGFVSTLDAGEMVSGRSLTSRVQAVKSLRDRMSFFREILQDRGQALEDASVALSGALSSILDKSAEVRSLMKAKDSEKAQQLARESLAEITEATREALAAARSHYSPAATDAE